MPTDIRSVQDFLAQDVYLPGYVNFEEQDFDKQTGVFVFNVREPPVSRGKIVHYATPRGYHICIAQAQYALVEHLLKEGQLPHFENLSTDELRKILLTGRIKIGTLYEHFGSPAPLDAPLSARFELRKIRKIGANPKLEFRFDFADRKAMKGWSLSSIEPERVDFLNEEVSKF